MPIPSIAPIFAVEWRADLNSGQWRIAHLNGHPLPVKLRLRPDGSAFLGGEEGIDSVGLPLMSDWPARILAEAEVGAAILRFAEEWDAYLFDPDAEWTACESVRADKARCRRLFDDAFGEADEAEDAAITDALTKALLASAPHADGDTRAAMLDAGDEVLAMLRTPIGDDAA